jgi:hypothetical protein
MSRYRVQPRRRARRHHPYNGTDIVHLYDLRRLFDGASEWVPMPCVKRFDQVSVEFLRTQESVMQSGDLFANDVYIAVDPAGGGKHSNFAMVAAIFIERYMVVSGSFICVRVCFAVDFVGDGRVYAPEYVLPQQVDVLVDE